jgi:hypothetical protein
MHRVHSAEFNIQYSMLGVATYNVIILIVLVPLSLAP